MVFTTSWRMILQICLMTMKEGRVTPYTYYMKYHDKRSDLINPFELYWTVISNLIHNVYHSDSKTCEVILDRAINGLKRFKERMGTKKYNEVMELFCFRKSEIQSNSFKIWFEKRMMWISLINCFGII